MHDGYPKILSLCDHTGLNAPSAMIFCWSTPSGEWLGAGFNLHEISQLAFAPITVERASRSIACGRHMDRLIAPSITF